MKAKKAIVVFVACLSLLFILPSGVWAKAFPAKDVTFVLPVPPGGGFDTVVRMLVPYLKKYLPNPVNIVVRNMPGGEWTIGINHVYRAKPDGYTVGIFNLPGNVVHMITGRAKYDLAKMTWFGCPADVTIVTALSPKSKYKTLKDLQEAPRVLAGVTGMASADGLFTLLATEAMGIKMDYVHHDGSPQAMLAAIRGDLDWVQYPYGSLLRHLESGDLIPVWVYAKKRLKGLPNVPTVAELGYEQLAGSVSLFRPVAGPPGLPDSVARVWRETLQKAAQDPKFVAAMDKRRLEPVYYGPEETAQKVKASLETFSRYKDVLLKALK